MLSPSGSLWFSSLSCSVRVTRNTEPLPFSDSASILPSIMSTMLLAIAMPRPVLP